MKLFKLVIVAMLMFSNWAIAGDERCNPPPAPVIPATSTANVSDSGSSNDSTRTLVITGIIFCGAVSLYKGTWCWKNERDTIITFDGKQGAPE